MKILSLLPLLLVLLSCQQTDDDNKNINANAKIDNKKPTVTHETTENSVTTSKNNFSVIIDHPYDVVESDEACSEPVVIEFFAYQCPHCYKLEKYAEKWKSKNAGKVKFQSVPTDLGHKEFGAFLIVHQAAKNLNLLNKAIPMLFKRLHEEKKGFSSPKEAVDFLVSIGASEKAAEKAIGNDKKIKEAMNENFRLLAQYKIAGVPTILVNHRYQFNVTKAGGYDKVFQVVEETLKLPSNCSSK